ncbi:MAG: hypothetical protein M0R06_19020 [Sphaerochaeta sp.]|jgi:hypothetical protein|nr:hypothetical protein [Sphaerochaeta sp.]
MPAPTPAQFNKEMDELADSIKENNRDCAERNHVALENLLSRMGMKEKK